MVYASVVCAGAVGALSSCAILSPPTVDDLPGSWVHESDGVTSTWSLAAGGAMTIEDIPAAVFETNGEDLAGTVNLAGTCDMAILGDAGSRFIYCSIDASGTVSGAHYKVWLGGSRDDPTMSFVVHPWAEGSLFTFVPAEER